MCTSSDIFVFVFSSYLCDVTLKSEDGIEFPCHKSVLCARQGEVNMSHSKINCPVPILHIFI